MSSRENPFTLSSATPAAFLAGSAPTVLVVDDHAAVREGVLRLLHSAATTWGEVVAVGSLSEARRAAARLRPDLVLLDMDLAGDDGLSLISGLPSSSRVLVLSSHDDAVTRERALRMGAMALMNKQAPAERLLALIHHIAAPDSRGDQTPTTMGS